jgi:hypothetical protein
VVGGVDAVDAEQVDVVESEQADRLFEVREELGRVGGRTTLVWTMISSRGNCGSRRPSCISDDP